MKLDRAFKWMALQMHKRVYADDVLALNEASAVREPVAADAASPSLLCIALPEGAAEIKRMERGRSEIFEGVRSGFARCYDALADEPGERGRGEEVAREVFPDEIMDYDPKEYAGWRDYCKRAKGGFDPMDTYRGYREEDDED
ncbi:hypothetical protein TeGR_g5063 [Tetraparma gracilis]|uniref:CCD97-like C-terminal domain-containing protein n=1 Tax=Tetraparma gracilis TaxID=2962635 RepID=A0ABQ6N9Y7_9STRA|nr:hypothetical protein TeGR_g5063 [Tetraparma gracilis]